MNRHRENYSTSELQTMFSVAYETIRQRVIEFEKHLSPTANPGDNRPRRFTEEDVKILALVDDMRPTSTAEEIHAAIQNGQRGDMPDLEAISIEETSPTVAAKFNEMQLREGQLLEQLDALRSDNAALQTELATWRDKANKLQGRLDETDRVIETERRIAVLEYQLEQARKQAGQGDQDT